MSDFQLSERAAEVLPVHVAIIMDGNGRWAKSRHLPRVEGHRRGAETVRKVVRLCGQLGIKYLTLYAFSAENWNRPKAEVDTLMKYLAYYLKHETGELMNNNVKLETIGHTERLPEKVRQQLSETKSQLQDNSGLTLVLALSYGARQEIVEATRSLAKKAINGGIDPEDINEESVSQHLFTAPFPDPELLIRTSGEFRLSNFLLWQISYAEFVVSSIHWPEFGEKDLIDALEEYSKRHRRFGGL